jgi:hypothetical protein
MTKVNQISCQNRLYVSDKILKKCLIILKSTISPPTVPLDPLSRHTPVSPKDPSSWTE